VSPERSTTGRRLYSNAEIERLQLLQSATSAGHSIGQIAHLPVERLTEMIEADRAAAALRPVASHRGAAMQAAESTPDEAYIHQCATAMERLDALALDATLGRAAVALGQPAVMDRVIFPFVQMIGERWRQGALRIAQEHLATAVVRAFLTNLVHRAWTDDSAPNLVVTTPAGQVHELGALMVAATAAAEGWKVTYLGPNLPAEEIVAATLHSKARAVGLSVVYPVDDLRLRTELKQLRDYLPDNVTVLVGGRAANEYSDVLEDIGAVQLSDLQSLRLQLESLRSQVRSLEARDT
jgi:methanogenic corrinoid protein MtbC1